MQVKVGDIVEGKVTGIKHYGAFVDIGEGKSGMVFIAEIAHTYVNDINDYLKLGQEVKAEVIGIDENGKISLSIKRTIEPPEKGQRQGKGDRFRSEKPQRERRKFTPPPKPDKDYVWTPGGNGNTPPASFDEMLNRFKQTSDDKISDLKRRNPEARRSKRGAGMR